MFFFFQAEDGIRDIGVTGVQTCALPISAVSGDRTRLIQVFWNLLNNAVKFSPEGGRVRVSLSADGGGSARGPVEDDGDRQSGVEGKSVDLGGRRIIKKKKTHEQHHTMTY